VKPDDKNIDDVLKLDFDIVSDQDAEQAGIRVWHRLQSASAPEARLDKAQPPATPSWRGLQLAAAAVLVMAAALGTAFVWRPADTALYRVVEGAVREGETIRSNGGGGAVLALSDGSRVEMRSNSELAVERASDGIRIRLRNGGIIVNAAKQRAGHLYVQTNDVTVSVVGTVFLVNADTQGSRVAVIEGEVRVQQGSTEQTLRAGDQVATNPRVPSPPVSEEIAWSRNQEALSLKLEQAVTLAVQGLELKLDLAGIQQDATATRPANTPKWEATSVRLCGPGIVPGARGGGAAGTVAAGGVRIDPSFLRVDCMRLRYLIEDAYVKYLEPEAFRQRWIFPVSGGPDWLDTDLYSIDARPAGGGPVDRPMMGGPMLQALLEDRFKLKLRREVRQEPVYELRVADGGFKLRPLNEGECEVRKLRISEEQGRNPPQAVPPGGQLTITLPGYTDADGRTVRPCGFVGIGQNDPNPGARTPRLYGARVYDLTNYLSLDRIILDKTGIQGLFDIEVTYGADVSPMGNRVRAGSANPVDAAPAQTPRVPSGADPVFAALEKQLGLKLVPTTGPRTYYVVEHVERPTPN
jgi:uncharacterized protein (TIGR03435 family)